MLSDERGLTGYHSAVSWSEKLGWSTLAGALLVMVVSAAAFDRTTWPAFEGDETTYLLQAESLAHDFDIRYTAEDHRRFQEHWGKPPDGVILQSVDGGKTLVYGKPGLYSLAIAPFVRFSPTRGASIANALSLALAAIATALSLRTWLGSTAPWWTTAFVFGTVTFAYVPWAHSDLFLASLVATAYALAFRRRGMAEEAVRGVRRDLWIAALLVGLVIGCRPVPYVALALPILVAALPTRRSLLTAGLALAAALAITVGFDLLSRGVWTSYGGQRLSFDSTTGFPTAGMATETWKQWVDQRGPADWTAAGRRIPYRLNPRTWAWNAWYFLVGRDIGLFIYYPALLLGLIAFRRDPVRWALLFAFLAVAAGFFLLRPFNFYGGGGALANRYILPAVPALWFLAGTPRSIRWALGLAALGALFLLPTWTSPWNYRLGPGGSFRWVSRWAVELLPYETTLSHLKPAGREDFQHGGLWIKPLDRHLENAPDGSRLRLSGSEGAELILGSPSPLGSVCLSSGIEAGLRIEQAAGLFPRYRRESTATRVSTARPTARHAMWWSEEDWFLYRLRIRSEGASARAGTDWFRLIPGCIEIRRER